MKPLSTITTALVVFSAVWASILPADAHHSFAMFDQTRAVTLTGTVKELSWVNPHVVIWLYTKAKDDSAPDVWTIELTSPGNLTRLGWTRHSLNVGDKITVEIAPLRAGTHGGAFKQATLADSGKVLTSSLKGLERPGVQ